MPSAELAGRVGLVTGGGRGIGAHIARELATAGMQVAVSARAREQVVGVAAEIGGIAVVADVSSTAGQCLPGSTLPRRCRAEPADGARSPDQLERRIDAILEHDFNAIRLRRGRDSEFQVVFV